MEDSVRRVRFGTNPWFSYLLRFLPSLCGWNAGNGVLWLWDSLWGLIQTCADALSSAAASAVAASGLAQDLSAFQGMLSFKIHILATTLFLFFISTTLISFILKQTQEKMLRFTFLLSYQIANHQPFLPLVAQHVVESMVFVPIIMGIYFFLFEFFSDQLVSEHCSCCLSCAVLL